MPYRLAIFDFDGTLADSGPWMVRALNAAAPRFGYRQLDDAEIQALRGKDSRAVMRELGVPLWKLPFIASHIRREAAKAPPPPLFPGMAEALADLRAGGLRLAIVSSNSETAVRRALGAQAAAIELYECSAGMFGKAAKFRRALRRAGVAPAEAITIGDETRDIEAARAAGIACAAVAWGYATPEVLRAHGPDALYGDIGGMVAHLSAREACPAESQPL